MKNLKKMSCLILDFLEVHLLHYTYQMEQQSIRLVFN